MMQFGNKELPPEIIFLQLCAGLGMSVAFNTHKYVIESSDTRRFYTTSICLYRLMMLG